MSVMPPKEGTPPPPSHAQAALANTNATQAHRFYHHRFNLWRIQGLSVRAAGAVSLAGCDTVEQITALGRGYFERLPNCAGRTMAELETIANWPIRLRTAPGALAHALAQVIGADQAKAAHDVLTVLREAGFVITPKRSSAKRASQSGSRDNVVYSHELDANKVLPRPPRVETDRKEYVGRNLPDRARS